MASTALVSSVGWRPDRCSVLNHLKQPRHTGWKGSALVHAHVQAAGQQAGWGMVWFFSCWIKRSSTTGATRSGKVWWSCRCCDWPGKPGVPNIQVAKFTNNSHSSVPSFNPEEEKMETTPPDVSRNRCHSRLINNARFILGTTVIYRSVSYFFMLFRPFEKATAFFRGWKKRSGFCIYGTSVADAS